MILLEEDHCESFPYKHRPQQQLHNWFEKSHIKYTFNHADPPEKIYQLGGVIQISLNLAANRVFQNSGEDATGLGQLVWTR